ncbi:hypothetical protein [Pseudochryseolinea flava]|uniref:Uncharacterized protein n=1 Tax=Pseudochryseolinea flava TaxID=2059302 RepID=A0A364XV89_9BACT|nr:hypothetical protein [Pseudochryseolinea flava]RAV98073.1 hypothetical protein DQQ10_25405 [Pseudochryseolinea flava]
MERIKFGTIKKEIQDIFPSANLENWDLIPESIHQLAASQGTDLQWERISNWIEFEEGQLEFEEEEFLSLAFYKHKPRGQIYLVTDSCFKTREAYRVDSDQLVDFVRNIDQVENEIPFVQPSDYVFINPEQKLVTLIHHEGQVTQYKRFI